MSVKQPSNSKRWVRHWYVRGSGKTACGRGISRHKWTWCFPADVNCTECKETETYRTAVDTGKLPPKVPQC